MAECVVCGRGVEVSGACPHCARPVCEDHRPPGTHGCPGVDADTTTGWRIDLDAADAPAGDASGPPGRVLDLLRPGGWLAVATLVLVAGVLAAAVLAPAGAADGLNETRVEVLVAEGANEERRAAGLDPLATNGSLAALAGNHSEDMYARGYVGHVDPDGVDVSARYDRAGLSCHGGENVYYSPQGGLATSERALADHVVRAFLNSPPHRETLMEERFTAQGVGVVVAPDGAVYVTQNFC